MTALNLRSHYAPTRALVQLGRAAFRRKPDREGGRTRKDEGGRMKDEVKVAFLSSFILHPSSFALRPPSRSGFRLLLLQAARDALAQGARLLFDERLVERKQA